MKHEQIGRAVITWKWTPAHDGTFIAGREGCVEDLNEKNNPPGARLFRELNGYHQTLGKIEGLHRIKLSRYTIEADGVS